jgi:hypothetical protein
VIEGNYLHKGKLEVAGDERQARTAITKVWDVAYYTYIINLNEV